MSVIEDKGCTFTERIGVSGLAAASRAVLTIPDVGRFPERLEGWGRFCSGGEQFCDWGPFLQLSAPSKKSSKRALPASRSQAVLPQRLPWVPGLAQCSRILQGEIELRCQSCKGPKYWYTRGYHQHLKYHRLTRGCLALPQC